MTMISAKLKCISFNCAMKMAATASYNAVPSMLMVAPSGSMNLVTLASTPQLSSRHLMVTGRVAELERHRIDQIVTHTQLA